MAKPTPKQLHNRMLAIQAFTAAFPENEWPREADDFDEWFDRVVTWTEEARNVPQRQRDYIQTTMKQLAERVDDLPPKARKYLKMPLIHLEHICPADTSIRFPAKARKCPA